MVSYALARKDEFDIDTRLEQCLAQLRPELREDSLVRHMLHEAIRREREGEYAR